MADSALPPPANLEYKDTRNTVIGHTPAAVPHVTVSGTALTDEQRRRADQVVGSPAQGNGLQNDNMAAVGGIYTDSGGQQTTPVLGKAKAAQTAAAPTS